MKKYKFIALKKSSIMLDAHQWQDKKDCLKLTVILVMLVFSFNFKTAVATEAPNQTFETKIKNFISQHIETAKDETLEVRVSSLETLHKQSSCETEINLRLPEEGTAQQVNAVVLQCTNPNWKLLVPVSIQIQTQVITAARTLPAGEIISAEDIVYENQDKNRLIDGYFKSSEAVIGLATTRLINTGAPLTKRNLKPIAMVKKNQTITLELKKGPIEIAMMGIAKSDGQMNQVIKVLNPSSKKIVDAMVTGKDRAKIIY